MSNTEPPLGTQTRRHAGPLIGMAVVVVLALGALAWWLLYEVDTASQPEGATEQVDGRTGEVEDVPEAPAPEEPSAEVPTTEAPAAAP